MTPPPAQRAKHHHDPRFRYQSLIRHHHAATLPGYPPTHARNYLLGQIIPVGVSAFGDPVAHPDCVVAGFAVADVLPGVAPVVHGLCDVGFDELAVEEFTVAFEAEEVFGRVVVTVVDSFEEF